MKKLFMLANEGDIQAQKYFSLITFSCKDGDLPLYVDMIKMIDLSQLFRYLYYEGSKFEKESFIDLKEFSMEEVRSAIYYLHKQGKESFSYAFIYDKLLIDIHEAYDVDSVWNHLNYGDIKLCEYFEILTQNNKRCLYLPLQYPYSGYPKLDKFMILSNKFSDYYVKIAIERAFYHNDFNYISQIYTYDKYKDLLTQIKLPDTYYKDIQKIDSLKEIIGHDNFIVLANRNMEANISSHDAIDYYLSFFSDNEKKNAIQRLLDYCKRCNYWKAKGYIKNKYKFLMEE